MQRAAVARERRDGNEFPVEINLSPFDAADEPLAPASIRDVSDRVRVEQDLLNAILGFTGTLLMGLPGELNTEQEKQLRIVQSSGRHLLSLINDLLDLARIESGKLELHLEPIDLPDLLEEVAVTLRPTAREKGLELNVAPSDVPAITSDRRALHQILINLTNNAIKFTDAGSVTLALSQLLKDGQPLTGLAVVDTGRGIRTSDQERLFAAFEQIGGSSAHPYEGTGLGLYICQMLAPLLGARITFESEFGVGSTFTLEVQDSAA